MSIKIYFFFFFLMIRRPPRSTLSSSSAASDVYKRQYQRRVRGLWLLCMRAEQLVRRERAAARKAARAVQESKLMMADAIPGSRSSNEQACMAVVGEAGAVEQSGVWGQLARMEESTGVSKWVLLGGAKVAGTAAKVAMVAMIL
eukprot:TRINITY_DN1403_c0_g1_i7.p1 TRINITY_DN1403_c0_g1~~TRINITY_DN1403_c0_g1_i7.p1  ORF type:complete len:144 (+),score=50.01 TRINITY_DN1403_c0_g1_i7:87-518(+)